MTDAQLLALAVDLAGKAGKAILAIRKQDFAVQLKADRSPVTEADTAAEAIIASGLRAATPDIPVIAEEEVAAGHIPIATPAFWLVDPLDGTREFASGANEFMVNIGLVRDGKAVLGVVGVPALEELFEGMVGVGAWKTAKGVRTDIAARLPPDEGLTVLASKHHGDAARLGAFLAERHVARVTNYGSSLKFCRLAEGIADVYPRFGRTMEWDTCAPQAVLEASGGTVRTLDGNTLRYGKDGWDNPYFVCTGRLADPH